MTHALPSLFGRTVIGQQYPFRERAAGLGNAGNFDSSGALILRPHQIEKPIAIPFAMSQCDLITSSAKLDNVFGKLRNPTNFAAVVASLATSLSP